MKNILKTKQERISKPFSVGKISSFERGEEGLSRNSGAISKSPDKAAAKTGNFRAGKGVLKYALPNGLRVILAPQKGSLASTVLVLVEAGSEYETKKINGLSHFLEHMCFKGTAKRPTSRIISSELDSLGAEYNAFTSQEYTGYWAKAASQKLPRVLDLVSDLYLNPTFEESEIEKERGVIIEEINMYEDTPMSKVHDIFNNLLYGDQPAGWDVAGTKQNIRALNRNDFIKYRSAHYIPSGTVVVIAGNFNPQATLAAISKQFSGMARGKKVVKPKTAERQNAPKIFIQTKDSDQTHLVIGVRAFDIFDPRRYALQVLSNILGGGMSSRLFHRVREELGAAYYVRASSDLLLDHGFMSVSAGIDTKKIDVVLQAVCQELSRLKDELVGEKELLKAKDHLTGTFILGLEGSDEIAGYYGAQELMTKKLLAPSEVVGRVKAVTASDVQKVARDLFKSSQLNMAVIGPVHDKKSLLKHLRI
jgi:predicted Zn-dependent peptidase